jgi:predicted nucleotidyltransferase
VKKDSSAALQHLGQERDHLLDRVTQVLEADERVASAWLLGSFGRAEADEWSDLDLHIAVEDEHLPALLDEHQALFARCGRPLLVLGGMPSNSMPGGRFWLVNYAPYMLEIDWNIGPTLEATRPEASLLLFDREDIPTTPPLSPAEEEQRRAEAMEQLTFFWAMAPIAIKYAGRGHTRLAVKQVDLLEEAYVKLWRAVRRPERLQREIFHQNRPLEAALEVRLPRFGPSIDPATALTIIRRFCQEVERLHPTLAELGASVNAEVVKEVAVLADLAEPVAQAGGSTPDRGSRR